jgi:hypothetical protein
MNVQRVRTEGPMAPEIDLSKERLAQYVLLPAEGCRFRERKYSKPSPACWWS